jgi:hypothetical protein
MAVSVAQAVEHLPSEHKALSWNPNAARERERENKNLK